MASSGAPAAASFETTVAVYGGRYPSRIRDPDWLGTPSVQNRSLTASGTPPSGFAVVGVLRRGLGDPSERVQLVGLGALAVRLEQLGVSYLPGADPLGRGGGREVDQLAHAAPGLGTPNPPSIALGCRRQHDLYRQRRLRFVRAQGVDDIDHVGRRRHALEVELADLLDVVEHLGKLLRHPLDLLLAQLEPRQAGNVENLFTIQHLSGPF